MPSPTTARNLLGHFPHGTDPPAAGQPASPLPVQSPTSSSLQVVSAAGAGGEAQGAVQANTRARRTAEVVVGVRWEIVGRKGDKAWHGKGGAGDNRGDRDNYNGGKREEKNN